MHMKKLLPALVAILLAVPAYASSDLFVSTSGDVGINNTSPTYMLDILGTTSTGITEQLSSPDTNTTDLLLKNTTTGGVAWYVGTAGSSNLAGETAGDFHIGLNGTGSYLLIGTGGNISIPYDLGVTGTFSVTGAATLGNGSTATTQSSGDNSTKIATTAYVDGAVSGGGGIKSVHVQTFTSSGTYTPTTGMAYAIVEMVGGGGGSGAGVSFCSSAGSGAYIKALLTAAQIGSSQTITIGSGGSAGAGGGTNTSGGNGGTTSVGSLLSCTGGDGTTGVANNVQSFTVGGAGGTPTVTTGTPILVMDGQTGGGASAVGGNPVGFLVTGSGGSTPLGMGGPAQSGNGSIVGLSGTGYGSGASGSGSPSGGGAGLDGIVIITEYCTQ
jgi:hypothetical protein